MTDSVSAEIYKVNVATVRRWKAAGKAAKLVAPLGNPVLMPDWWAEMVSVGAFHKPCPESVQEAAGRVAAALPGDSIPQDPEGPDSELQALLAAIESGKDFSYGDGVKVAERNVQVTDFLLLRALRRGDDKKVGPLHKRLNDAQDSLRALQRDKAKIEADAGETFTKAEIRAELLEIHGNITRRFRQSLKSIHPEIAERSATQASWNVFVDTTVDLICAKLTGTGFAARH